MQSTIIDKSDESIFAIWRVIMNMFAKRISAAVLTAVLALTSVVYVRADELTDLEAAKQASYDTAPETNSISGWPQGPQVYANSAIVMDMNSGAILYGKKIEDQHYPASITKLMTALVAVENADLDDEVYFSEDSTSFLEYGDASIGMTPGETLNMKDALHGMLLASANEVSYAIAESVGKLMGGDYNTFIQEMNDRAAELGCTGSHWVNANGLHDEQHYTTAHDMALIAAEVCKHQECLDIMQTLNYTIGATNLVGESRTFQQNHKMLWEGGYHYFDCCIGGKVGYTDQARSTLVTMADNGELKLAAVVLQDDGDIYVDTRALLDYGFANFSKVSLADQPKAEGVRSYTDENAYVVLPSGVSFADIESTVTITDEKEAAGKVTYSYQGQNVGSADVVLTAEYVEAQTGYSITPEITGKDGGNAANIEKEGLPDFIKVLIGVGAGLVLVLIVFCLIVRYQLQKRRRQRMQRTKRRRQMERSGRQHGARHSAYRKANRRPADRQRVHRQRSHQAQGDIRG